MAGDHLFNVLRSQVGFEVGRVEAAPLAVLVRLVEQVVFAAFPATDEFMGLLLDEVEGVRPAVFGD
jgi:hypothetical protein